MRILQGLLVGLLLALSAGGASASGPPAPSYSWAQPGAIVSTPFAQPPAWIFTVETPSAPPLLSGYRWAQPGAAIVSTPFAQPPAWILIG